MVRGKTTMELIKNERSRMITYHKRKKGLMKKVEEFRILCGVDACMIILGPKFNYPSTDIETWPRSLSEMRAMINKYKGAKGSDVRGKKIQNLSDYFAMRKKKIDDEISRLHKAKVEAKRPKWHNQLNFLSSQQLWSLAHSLETKIEVAKRKGLEMKNYQGSIEGNSNMAETNYQAHSLFPSSMKFDFVGKQSMSSIDSSYPFDQALYDQQLLPFNVNPMDNAMLISGINCEDFTHLGGLNGGMMKNKDLVSYEMLLDSPGMLTMGWYSPLMQPMLPYIPMMPNAVSDQKCTISPLTELSDNINGLEVSTKGGF